MQLYNTYRLYVKKYNLSVQFLLTSAPTLQGLSLQPGAALRGVLYQEADREEKHGKMKGGIFIDFT